MSERWDFRRAARQLGYVEDGTCGSGHKRLRHTETGAVVFVSATPRGRYGWRAAIRDLERAAGRRLTRARSGKYRHRPPIDDPIT